ncbi:hypothetical protein B0T21DRAFT_346868 [Apiosordaria backusii]|uniref:Uncharacterized protein n=1 Tax=Apiosordaria backusii TaxID=314023 RepID=A0AA40EI73_9PEZI|nr:hypothetical protein B0T21DRAFT_346868 [Apiosordaria backusii]
MPKTGPTDLASIKPSNTPVMTLEEAGRKFNNAIDHEVRRFHREANRIMYNITPADIRESNHSLDSMNALIQSYTEFLRCKGPPPLSVAISPNSVVDSIVSSFFVASRTLTPKGRSRHTRALRFPGKSHSVSISQCAPDFLVGENFTSED